ncbi:hypothetical protein U1Q18_050922 [Sarracenia purpurea var. burkii]
MNMSSSELLGPGSRYEIDDQWYLKRHIMPVDEQLDTVSSKYSKDVPPASANIDLESNTLSAEIFPTEIIDLLSPEIFSQPDPVLYLLKKIITLPHTKLKAINYELTQFLLFQREKFPPRYLPYVQVLSNLLNVQVYLEDTKIAINKMRQSSTSAFISPPTGYFSAELSELFSSDIFSDDRAPFSLIVKLTNIPKDKVEDLSKRLKTMFIKNRIPENYKDYAKQLWIFLLNQLNLERLVGSVSTLRDTISSKSSAPDGQRSNDARVRNEPGYKTSSAKAPLFATHFAYTIRPDASTVKHKIPYQRRDWI